MLSVRPLLARRRDRGLLPIDPPARARELYERFGVPEYWYVDLESDRVEISRLGRGGYDRPIVLSRDDTLESPLIPSFAFDVEDLLGWPEE